MSFIRYFPLKQIITGRLFAQLRVHRYEFLIAALLFSVCGIAALTGYAIRVPREEKNPPRILFMTNGGQVLFGHRHHSDENGGGFACTECHHNEDANADSLQGMTCRICHYNNADIVEAVCADDPTHPRCIGKRCQTCHEGEECNFCHRKQH